MKKYLLTLVLGCSVTPVWAADLMDVYQQAAQSDPVYQAAVSTRLSNREALPQSIAVLLPNISGTANTTGNRTAAAGSVNPNKPDGTYHYNSKGYTLTLNQPLINFSDWMQVSQAHYTAKEADATLAAAAQDLIMRVAQAYFNVLYAQDNLRYVQAEKAAYARQLDQEKARYSVGLDAITSVYNAQASYDAAVASEITAQNTLHDNQEALRQLTGQIYPSLDVLKIELPLLTPQPNNVEQWVDTATQHNAQLIASTYTMEAARQNIKINFGDHLPTLSAVGAYGRTSSNGPSSTGAGNEDGRTIGLQLSVPIFSGGATSSQVRKAQDDFQTASANRENQYRQTMVTTRQKFNDVLAGISKVDADRQAILSAQSSLDSTEESFKVGTRTIVDVLNAEQALYQAKSNYSQDEYSYLVNTLLLKQAAGTLGPNDLVAINHWLHGANQRDEKLVGTQINTPTIIEHTTHTTKPMKKHASKTTKHHKTIKKSLKKKIESTQQTDAA